VSEGARSGRHPDRLLMFTTVLLCGAGLVMVTSASVAFAYTQHQSAFYYAERQAAWMLIGFAGLFLLGANVGLVNWGVVWPAALIVLGIVLWVRSSSRKT